MGRLNWLDSFAEEQVKKMEKVASSKIERFIMHPNTFKNVKNNELVKLDKVTYKVINASFEDDNGPGILLEKVLCQECGDNKCKCDEKTAMISQEFARSNPGDVYHMEIRDQVEQPKFEQEARETADAIEKEDSIDGTKGSTRPNRILEKMKSFLMPTPVVEEPIEEPVEEPIEEPVEELVEKTDEKDKLIMEKVEKLATGIEEEMEEVLEDAEKIVKDFIPAKYIKSTLIALEKSLENEGIEALFDKRVSREILRKTASEELSKEEIKEFVEKLVEVFVEEVEDLLGDADELADEMVAEFEGEDMMEIESSLKNKLESLMADKKGIYCKFARKNTK